MGLHPLIIVDVKSTRNNNWIRPFDECEMWMSSLPAATSIMGLHPLVWMSSLLERSRIC